MGLKCRDQDIALIVYDEPDCIANIGQFVRVHGPASFHSQFAKTSWVITPINGGPLSVKWESGRVTRQLVDVSDRIMQPDAWLLPIRPEKKISQDEQAVHGDSWI